MKYAMIKGTGSYLPKKIVTNQDLEKKMDTTDEWIFSRTGIRSRRISEPHETTAFMAGEAAKEALKAADLTSDNIDLILVATCTPSAFFPSMACHVSRALNISRAIPALDIGAACSGFVYAMDVAKQYIASGAARFVMVVGSETMSLGLDWNDRSTCVLFGDGAGAVLLGASDTPGIIGSVLHAEFDTNASLTYPNSAFLPEKVFIKMKGNEVFRLAVNMMGDIVDEVLQVSGLTREDIDWLVPHQANIRIIQAIAKKLDLPIEKVILTLENQGNTSAASIPLALDEGIKTGRIKPSELVLIESFGAGMTWGAMLIQMPGQEKSL